jgi:hypothetical protein
MPERFSDVPLANLVPETREWNDGNGISLKAWIACVGSIEHAIAYGELFWPEFVEFDGCVFFGGYSAESYRESYQGFMEQTCSNKQAVEKVMNHRHILDLFCCPREPTREQVVYLGRLLKEMWSAKLQRDFPNKRFVVSFSEERSDDLLDYEVTFFQERG